MIKSHKNTVTFVAGRSCTAAISEALMSPFVTAQRELDDFHASQSFPAHTAADDFNKAS